MKLELLFKILAGIFIGIAAFFLWHGNQDGTFVAAVLGCVCFFLSVRFQVKKRLNRRGEETQRNLEQAVLEQKERSSEQVIINQEENK